MEILIIGVVIVALMAYVSTRIKKSAASAFERETIETDEFFVVKPEGFIHPLRDKSEFAFEAYSKEFGQGEETGKLYKAQATLRVSTDADFGAYVERAKSEFDEISSEEKTGTQTVLLKGESGSETQVFRKIVAQNGKVYDLRAAFLNEARDEYSEKTDELIKSFRVK
jgi:hypothetical protein